MAKEYRTHPFKRVKYRRCHTCPHSCCPHGIRPTGPTALNRADVLTSGEFYDDQSKWD